MQRITFQASQVELSAVQSNDIYMSVLMRMFSTRSKLYVTKLEAVDQISIGTSANGYLDIVTTPTGVGFKWRS